MEYLPEQIDEGLLDGIRTWNRGVIEHLAN